MIPKAEATRLRIIEAAAELMGSRGYARTGVEAILERTGASKGNFYHHFPSKEELGFAVLDHLGERVQETLRLRMDGIGDPLRRIDVMLEALTDSTGNRDGRGGCPLGNLAAEMSDENESFRARLQQVFDAWRALVASTLRGALTGPGAPAGRVDSLAHYVLCCVEGSVLMAKVTREFREVENTVEHLKGYIRHQLAAS